MGLKMTSNKAKKGAGLAKKVAEHAGVSLMTVSRVFQNSPRVSEKTRALVLEAARIYGYHPNNSSRILRQHQIQLAGFVTGAANGFENTWEAKLFMLLQEILRPRNLTLSLLPRGNQSIEKHIRGMLSPAGYRIHFIAASNLSGEARTLLDNIPLPIVLLGSPETQNLHSICFDVKNGIFQAFRYLQSLGHQRIALIAGGEEDQRSLLQRQGAEEAIAQLSLDSDPNLLCFAKGRGFEQGAEVCGKALANLSAHPTAFVCGTDELAAGVIHALRAWGKVVPHQVSVIGFDGSDWSEYPFINLTTVVCNPARLIAPLDGVLDSLMDPVFEGKISQQIQPELVIRETAARPD